MTDPPVLELSGETRVFFDAIIARVGRRGEGITLPALAGAHELARALAGGADPASPRVESIRRELGI